MNPRREAARALIAKWLKEPRKPRVKPPRGAGTYLKAILKRLGYASKVGCKCNGRARLMNSNGIEWCQTNVETIVGWLKEEADRQELAFFETGARLVVHRAIKLAEKFAAKTSIMDKT